MHKRTKALAITPKVRQAVENRDNGLCIFCKRPGRGEAHYVARSQGGLGIEENILTVCRECHNALDNTERRQIMKRVAAEYLRECYPGWNEDNLIYQKWNTAF